MSKRVFFGVLLLFLLTRAALVLSLADVFYYGDEVSKGGAAKALQDGIGVPSWQLNYVYHEGGGLLLVHLKALLFRLIGPSILVHKIAAILTSSVLLLVGFRLTSAHFGDGAAAIFGFLFVFCPESFLRFSLLSLGTHFEALILVALILHFTMRIVFDDRPSLLDWGFLGASCALGLFVSLQSAPAIGIAALAIALRLRLRKKLFGKGLLAALLGFALGGIPLWVAMSHVGLDALTVQNHPRFDQGLRGLAALRELFHQLVRAPDLWSWVWFAAVASVVAAGFLWVRGVEGRRLRGRCSLLLAYLAFYFVLYAGSGFALPHTGVWFFWLRCAPLWFVSIVVFAACAASILAQSVPRRRELALGALALLAVAGVADWVGLLRSGRPGKPAENWRIVARTKGYDLPAYFDKLVHHLDTPFPERAAVLLRLREDPDVLLPAIAYSLFERTKLSLADTLAFARANLGSHWTSAAKGLGLVAAPTYGKDLETAWRSIRESPEEVRAELAEGVGRVALGIKITADKIDQQVRIETPSEFREPFLRGAGWRVHALHRLRPDLAEALIDRQPAPVREIVREGYSRARRANTLP